MGEGAWRKASGSVQNGACVEVGSWRKARASLTSACVEVGAGEAVVGVRDTVENGQEGQVVLTFGVPAWKEFLAGLR